MEIAFQPFLFAADHKSQFCMSFQSRQTVGDMNPDILKSPGPDDIVLFIKSCFEFHECGNLFALLSRFHQCLDNQ